MLTSSLFSPDDFLCMDVVAQAHYVWDILGNMHAYLERHVFRGILGDIEPGVILKNESKIEIARGAYVESGAYIVGPCVIGAGSQVRHGAYLRGGNIIGRDCVVGHCTEMKGVLCGHRSKAAHFAYVGDSVLGSDVNLGAGVRCANLRLDKKEISLRYRGQKYATGLCKLGAFLGAHVSIGCNSVLNPGTVLPQYSQVLPGTVVS